MHLSSSFYKPALLSVDCNRVSVGSLRGSGSQGISGRGHLPLPPHSMDEEREPCPRPGGRRRTGALHGQETCSGAGWAIVGDSS